ncbi:MAG TPA: hypothetical protein VGE07_11480 [Herpetosiphonaceae bacterium]
MMRAIGGQWLALRKRPMLGVLAGVYLGLLALQFFAPVALINLLPRLDALGGSGAINPDAAAALKQTVQLPSAFATIFSHVNGMGGLMLMVLSGAFVGADAGWGAQRALLARQPGRMRYLASKLGALALLALVLVLASLPLGVALAWLASGSLGLESSIPAEAWPLVGRGALIAWLGLLPYVLLAAMWAVIGRSAAAGITGSLGYWILEIGLGVVSIFQALGGAGESIYNLTLAQSVGAWTELTRKAFNVDLGRAFGQLGFSFPALPQAAAMAVFYSGLFLGAAWLAAERRDVRGPQ